jgi:hypothetical protein
MSVRPLCLLLAWLVLLTAVPATAARFAVAEGPTPVLNTPDFRAVFGGRDGKSLQTDRCGQLRALEFVALPGTVFVIEAELPRQEGTVYRVTTADYPYPAKGGYYLDSRFVRPVDGKPPERTKRLPRQEVILDYLRGTVGARYVWGGNQRGGVAELLKLYPPAGVIPAQVRDIWQLKGVDCSGLLYEATAGAVPRNTSALVDYGQPVAVAGRSAAEIAELLKPLDLLVWSGHVLIVLDRGEVIESRLDCANPANGVIVRQLRQVLAALLQTRKPADRPTGSGEKSFVVRRWYSSGL